MDKFKYLNFNVFNIYTIIFIYYTFKLINILYF